MVATTHSKKLSSVKQVGNINKIMISSSFLLPFSWTTLFMHQCISVIYNEYSVLGSWYIYISHLNCISLSHPQPSSLDPGLQNISLFPTIFYFALQVTCIFGLSYKRNHFLYLSSINDHTGHFQDGAIMNCAALPWVYMCYCLNSRRHTE